VEKHDAVRGVVSPEVEIMAATERELGTGAVFRPFGLRTIRKRFESPLSEI
jgi:hypothetical protein